MTIPATVRRAALGVLLASGAFAVDAVADPIIDPIVRVREGGESIPVTGVPFTYDFGFFPGDPDGAALDCVTGTDIDTGLPMVSCAFQNRTGKTLSLLDFFFVLPPDPGTLAFFVEDPDDFFTGESISPAGATFAGGGIPTATCDGDFCFGGEFIIDLVGFPEGTGLTGRFAVPEPGVVGLLLAAVGLAAIRRRRS